MNKVLSAIKNRIIYSISKTGLTILRTRKLEKLLNAEFRMKRDRRIMRFISEYGVGKGAELATLMDHSKGQLDQDLWILLATNFQRNGIFAEIGGADGIAFSNTYLLEKKFDWRGVIVEPALIWQQELRINRNCEIDSRCCAAQSKSTIDFIETPSAMLSTIEKYRYSDSHSHERIQGKRYTVKTVSLNDLFTQYFPENQIDYLSIDTEGSEYEILREFDFSRFSFRFASIEIAFDRNKGQRIYDLLSKNGYRRVLEDVSEFDDYYEKI